MSRYHERQLQWTDVIGRFEAGHSDHIHRALAVIGSLKDEGVRFGDRDSQFFHKWQGYCTVLWTFLNNLGQRRETQGLETAMREFIREFEHSTGKMYQLLYEFVDYPDNDQRVKETIFWFDLVYRWSTYTLVSAWIQDKRKNESLRTIVDLASGEVREEGTRSATHGPKKYRKPL